MKRILRFFGLLCLLLVLASCAIASQLAKDPFAQTKEAAHSVGEALVSENGGSSAASIAILYKGSIIYSEGFGLRDMEQKLGVDEQTRFNIGSISKIFTAASVLLLQEDGLLDLDDKVCHLLPAFALLDERYKDITVRMLLNHTSGLQGTNMLGAFTAAPNDEYIDQTLETLAQTSLKSDPGVFAPYCNDGFTVAQALVEHLSGLFFADFLQQRIFGKLGMRDSSVGFAADEQNMAYGYNGRTTRLPVEYLNIVGSGGITSTAEDLCRFALALSTEELFNESSLAEYLADQKPYYTQQSTFSRLLTYGLGWDFVSWEPYQSQGVQVLGKTGGTFQYSTILYALPQTQSAVVVLASGQMDHIGSTLPIVDAFLKESGQMPDSSSESKQSSEAQALPFGIEAYSGYYAGGLGLVKLSFNQQDSTLLLETYDGDSFVEASTSTHIGNGIFEDQKGVLNAFETLFDVPCLLNLQRPFNNASIALTRLEQEVLPVDHDFVEGMYLPLNFMKSDLYFPMFNLLFVEEMPSYLLLDGVAYLIVNERRTAMVIPVLRDQAEPSIDEHGHLVISAYQCISASDIPLLEAGESIVVEGDMQTVYRRIGEQGTFECKVPEGGRIIVIAPDFSEMEDSLQISAAHMAADVPGSYVAFMADKPAVFQPSFSK
jgi:CubicO group peptidase (beta-lactamase class C family)